MGVLGPGIFSDDIACDVRDRYRDLLGEGLTGQQATQALLEEWREELDDPDVFPVFWLALAATQWRSGRLEPQVKAQALEIIDRGSDLARWQDDQQLLRRRKLALNKLRETLLSPQPPEKKGRKKFRDTCEWEIGEVIGYRLLSETFVMFRVIGYHVDRGGIAPVFEILDWTGDHVPERRELESVGVKKWSGDRKQLMVGRVSARELPRDRVVRTGFKMKPHQKKPQGYTMTLWRWLDRDLNLFLRETE